jgi:hypothetical protein
MAEIATIVFMIKYALNFVRNSNNAGAKTIEIDQFLNIVFGIFQTSITNGYINTYRTICRKRLLPKESQDTDIIAAKIRNL